MYVLTDVRYHDKYNILKSQKNKIFIQGVKNDDIGFSKFNSNKKKGSYLKSRGCYVEGFHIANEYKELFL